MSARRSSNVKAENHVRAAKTEDDCQRLDRRWLKKRGSKVGWLGLRKKCCNVSHIGFKGLLQNRAQSL